MHSTYILRRADFSSSLKVSLFLVAVRYLWVFRQLLSKYNDLGNITFGHVNEADSRPS